VKIGRGTWVGIGSVIRDHIEIGTDVLVGAGSVVVSHLPDQVVAFGVPARVVKARWEQRHDDLVHPARAF
jgi:UDP-N-acetylbacillosamine N-acetyltransferase